MTLLDRLNTLPPFFCRYVARTNNGRRGLTTREIEQASGLARSTVKELSLRPNWNNVTVEVATKFMSACGVDPLAARRQREFMKRRKLHHVETATGSQKKMYDRIEKLMVAEAQKRAANQSLSNHA